MTDASAASPAQEVLAVFGEQSRWMVERRADLLDGVLDDAFTARHITGYVSPKSEWLDQIRSGEFVYHSIRDEGTTVDVRDGSATVVSRAEHDVTLHGRRGRYRLQSELHYVLTAEGWRAVRGSSTTY